MRVKVGGKIGDLKMAGVDMAVLFSFVCFIVIGVHVGYPYIKCFVQESILSTRYELDLAAARLENAQEKFVQTSRELEFIDREVACVFAKVQDQIALLVENVQRETKTRMQSRQKNFEDFLKKFVAREQDACEQSLVHRIVLHLDENMAELSNDELFQELFFKTQVRSLRKLIVCSEESIEV